MNHLVRSGHKAAHPPSRPAAARGALTAWRLAPWACLLLAVVPAVAQSTTATLVGRVRTETGEVVEGAEVRARSESTGSVRVVRTDARGEYRIDLLRPGRWTVAARLDDGRTAETRSVELALQETVTLDFTAGRGLEEQVAVVAEAPLVDRRRTSGVLRVQGRQADVLPVDGANVSELALLDATVQEAPVGNFYGERGSVFVVNGQTGRSNSFLVDGLDNNDHTSGTSQGAFFSQLVIREFVVLTNQYAPEFGRAAGGVVNVITRQGTNETRGEFQLRGSSRSWNRSGELARSLPGGRDDSGRPSHVHAGFRLGGPLKEDRAFYFVAFEHQNNDDVFPYHGFDGDGDGGVIAAAERADNLFFRSDFHLGNAHTLMLRFSADDRESPQVNVGGSFTPEFGFHVEERDLQFAASLNSVLGGGWLNELRLLAGSSRFDQFANSDRPGVERSSGLTGGNQLHRQQRTERRLQLLDNVTRRRGRHTVKLGLDLTHVRTDLDVQFNPKGSFLYTTDDAFEPGDCGDLIASQVDPHDPRAPIPCPGIPGVDDDGDGRIDEPGFIYTYPLVYQFIFGAPSTRLDDTRVGLFAQDEWESGRWLLQYGLRYDAGSYRPPETTRVPSWIDNGGAGRDLDNLAPRFGFTFSPGDGRTVLRGGAGVFFDKLVLGFPAVAAITSGTEIGLIFPQGLTFEITEQVVEQFIEQFGYEAFLETLQTTVVFPQELLLRFSTAPTLDTPYTVQYTLGLDRRVGRRGVVTADLSRALGYRVPLMRDLNPVVAMECGDGSVQPLPDPDPCLGLPRHLDTSTGSIAALTTEGRSWYSGLRLGWQWRGEHAWCSASYAWSKSEDLGPDPLKGGVYLPPDHTDPHSDRGPSDADRRHRLVISGQTSVPFMGLELSGVFRVASELPFNLVTGLDENRDGINTDRLPGVGRNRGNEASLAAINALRAEQALPPARRPRSSSFVQLDLRLGRPFAYRGGRSQGSFFLQVLNLLDRYNAGPPEGRITSRNFGRPVALAGPPRTVELGLTLTY